ncbi:MAG TPA: LysM domain-containing protein [Burkholderiales bacterium]|nr:LysM domain-containing protein [Burkholderiales bacterium]
MKNRIISLLVAVASIIWAASTGAQELKADAPDRYTVQRGDTLWGISGRYLESPWNWPKLWDMNREQVRNPHRIYPGDVLVLDRSTGRLHVDTVAMSPRVRSEDISQAVPTIPPSAIEAFVSRPMVVGENELDSAPQIMATEESRVVVGAGNVAYVKGLTKDKGEIWYIYRRGDKLVDPDTGATLGYLGLYLGEAVVRQFGEISRIEITKSTQEIYTGDRLVAIGKEAPVFAYAPRAPNGKVQGRVMSLTDNLAETGSYSVVSLSRGSKDGLEAGHILALYRSPNAARYSLRTSAMFGRTGPSGSDARRPYVEEQLNVRTSPLFSSKKQTVVSDAELAKIPDDRYGLVMVFRTFEHASFALVMQARLPVAIEDMFTTP